MKSKRQHSQKYKSRSIELCIVVLNSTLHIHQEAKQVFDLPIDLELIMIDVSRTEKYAMLARR